MYKYACEDLSVILTLVLTTTPRLDARRSLIRDALADVPQTILVSSRIELRDFVYLVSSL